jgi:DNA-binding transcriptional LysR family regulator
MISALDGPLLMAFAAVVRQGSFSGAATELKLSKSVVSDRVRQLEERCGARLLERTTRRLRLTAAGQEVLDAAHQVTDALASLGRRLAEARREPAGLLRVATTIDLAPQLVAPVVARMVRTWPKLQVEIVADDAAHDLLAGNIDVAVRLGAPKSSTFVARKLATLAEPIVASPALAEVLGPVSRPRDLALAPWVRHALLPAGPMRFTGPDAAADEVTPPIRVSANTGAAVLALILAGAGVGVFPLHGLHAHLEAGRLVQLCPGWIWRTVSLYALMPSRPTSSPAVDALLEMLRDEIARTGGRWAGDVQVSSENGVKLVSRS